MTAMALAVSTALLQFVWQGMVVALVLWVALYALRKRSAQSRYAAACAALAVLAGLPVATAWMAWAPGGTAEAGAAGAAGVLLPMAGAMAALPDADWMARLQAWALPAWSLGVLLFSARLVWGCRQVAVLRRRGEAAAEPVAAGVKALAQRLGVKRAVRVLMTDAADGPSVVGWMRPVILLPSATLMGLTTQQLEAVLAHELAHIRRHDYLVNLFQSLVETLLFYHPAVWWASARIRHERELCCDDLAVRSCGDALCYARALTLLERLRLTAPKLAMGSTGGSMLYRIQRLVSAGNQEYGPSKLSGVLAFGLGLACLGLNTHWARGQEAPKSGAARVELGYSVLYRNADAAGVTVEPGAAVLHRMPVTYPRAAAEKGIQGLVVVEATVDASGSVEDARIVSGPQELRRAALQSVLGWHFQPGAQGMARQVSIQFRAAEALKEPSEPQEVMTMAARAELVETKLRAEAEMLARHTGEPVPAEAPVRRQRDARAVEHELAEMQARRERAREEQARETNPIRREKMTAELEAVTARLNKLQHEAAEPHAGVERGLHEEGWSRKLEAELARSGVSRESVVVNIEVVGLPDAAKAEVMSRANVKVGDKLMPADVERVMKAVRSYDEHLEVGLHRRGDDGYTLRIASPGAGGVFLFRQ